MVTCYPQPGKRKAQDICEAFAAGVRAAGGDADVCTAIPATLKPGVPVFYGVRPAWAHLWEQAKVEGRDWYFIDNSYFDCVRERQFRVTKNAMQHDGAGESTGERFRALGVTLKPWREDGEHVVVCPQSDEFMRTCCGWDGHRGTWLEKTVGKLAGHTERQIRTRGWSANKKALGVTLKEDLKGAWALITHSSAAGIAAIIAGIPVISNGDGALTPLSGRDLTCIDEPFIPGNELRLNVLSVLADRQWTLEELASGTAWKALNAC